MEVTHRSWRCKTCGRVVLRRTAHNQPNGMECLGRSYDEPQISKGMNAANILEGSIEVDVNEYGEIVPKDGSKGFKLKPQTFY